MQSRRVIRELTTCVCTFRGFPGNNDLTPAGVQVLTNRPLSLFLVFINHMQLFVRTIIYALKGKTRRVAVSCRPVSAITTRFQLHVHWLSALKLIRENNNANTKFVIITGNWGIFCLISPLIFLSLPFIMYFWINCKKGMWERSDFIT